MSTELKSMHMGQITSFFIPNVTLVGEGCSKKLPEQAVHLLRECFGTPDARLLSDAERQHLYGSGGVVAAIYRSILQVFGV